MNHPGLADAPTLVYLMDPHCGWCYGFSDTAADIWDHYARDDRLGRSLVTGGLFHPAVPTTAAFADEKRPIAQRVSRMFGVQFHDDYFSSVLGSGHLDSLVPCRAINAVQALAPDEGFPFSRRLMHAAFSEGRDISDEAVCLDVAVAHGVSRDAVHASVRSAGVWEVTQRSFAFARQVGAGFPALFLRHGNQLTRLGGANLTLETVKPIIAEALADAM